MKFTNPRKLMMIAKLIVLPVLLFFGCSSPPEYDVIIKNGRIIDGTGNPWYIADVGIKDGRIVKIGLLSDARAKKIIDATGRVVSPGFIDVHTHTDDIIKFPMAHNYIMQGVTTVIGNCCCVNYKSAVIINSTSLLAAYIAVDVTIAYRESA